MTTINASAVPDDESSKAESRPCRWFKRCGEFVKAPPDTFAWCPECANRFRQRMIDRHGEDSEAVRTVERLNEAYCYDDGTGDPRQKLY